MAEPTPPSPPTPNGQENGQEKGEENDQDRPGVSGSGAPPRRPQGVVVVAGWIARILVEGPDPAENDQPRGFVGTLFPWWVRWLLVVATGIIGGVWASAGIAEQLSWGLDYAALIGVSLAASHWRLILGINLVLSVAWFIPFRARKDVPSLWRILHVITFLNRQVGHLEAMAVWLALALVAWPRLNVQLPFVTAVVLLGPPIINGLARIGWSGNGGNGGNGGKRTGKLNWRRRPFIYAATLLGLFVLAMQARHQVGKLVPIVAAIVLGGLAPRFLRALWRDRNVNREAASQQQGKLDERANFRATQMRWARLDVALGPVLILLLAAGTIAFAWQQRRNYDAAMEEQVNPASGGDGRLCLKDPGGPAKPEVSLFIVADTQLHELQGRRFPGQIELADVFVPVAIRPVELDLLSVATWSRFASVYRQLELKSAAAGGSLGWAHLGDFVDLSCVGEMSRAADMFARFKDGRLVGVAPGNHDKSFTGNFFWSPFWDVACHARLEKLASDAMLPEAAERRLVPGAVMRPVPDGSALGRWLTGRGSALVTVSPMGIVHHRDRERGVIAVFMDTADEKSFDYGIAGLFGTVSPEQIRTLRAMIRDLQRGSSPPYRDPVYVLFGHHPFEEITPDSQKRIARFIGRLDRAADSAAGGQADPADGSGDDSNGDLTDVELDGRPAPRVLALITAHTHLARAKYHCMGGRFVREIVVGSTIDPPQEASLLTVGADDRGVPALRLRTLPAVAREGRTCGSEPTISALQCQQVVGALAEEPDCRRLFESDATPGLPAPTRAGPRPDCQVLEKSLSLTERLKATGSYRGPDTAEGIKTAQMVRTRRLFACLCRGGRCTPPPAALTLDDDRAYHEFFLNALEHGDPGRRDQWEKELTCLSWAASAVQAHKSAGMTMADALRCGFDDATLPPAKEYVTVLESRSCE